MGNSCLGVPGTYYEGRSLGWFWGIGCLAFKAHTSLIHPCIRLSIHAYIHTNIYIHACACTLTRARKTHSSEGRLKNEFREGNCLGSSGFGCWILGSKSDIKPLQSLLSTFHHREKEAKSLNPLYPKPQTSLVLQGQLIQHKPEPNVKPQIVNGPRSSNPT